MGIVMALVVAVTRAIAVGVGVTMVNEHRSE